MKLYYLDITVAQLSIQKFDLGHLHWIIQYWGQLSIVFQDVHTLSNSGIRFILGKLKNNSRICTRTSLRIGESILANVLIFWLFHGHHLNADLWKSIVKMIFLSSYDKLLPRDTICCKNIFSLDSDHCISHSSDSIYNLNELKSLYFANIFSCTKLQTISFTACETSEGILLQIHSRKTEYSYIHDCLSFGDKSLNILDTLSNLSLLVGFGNFWKSILLSTSKVSKKFLSCSECSPCTSIVSFISIVNYNFL